MAPTAITSGSQAGRVIVVILGPKLPAAATHIQTVSLDWLAAGHPHRVVRIAIIFAPEGEIDDIGIKLIRREESLSPGGFGHLTDLIDAQDDPFVSSHSLVVDNFDIKYSSSRRNPAFSPAPWMPPAMVKATWVP
jgi:hypothetical protein